LYLVANFDALPKLEMKPPREPELESAICHRLPIMSKLTYTGPALHDPDDKPLVWLHGEIKTPPFSRAGRLEAGLALRRLQQGDRLGMPLSRPMPGVGRDCHELRVRDIGHQWRVIYRIDDDAIVIAEVFAKKTARVSAEIIEVCRQRLRRYDDAQGKAQSVGS
jgi:phage-related protein